MNKAKNRFAKVEQGRNGKDGSEDSGNYRLAKNLKHTNMSYYIEPAAVLEDG